MAWLLQAVFVLCFAHFHCATIEDLYESGGKDFIDNFVHQSDIFEDGVNLKIKLHEEDDHGNKLIRMQQFYNGIRVYDSHIVFNDLSAIDQNEDTNRFVTGTFIHDLGPDLSEAELENETLEKKKNQVLSNFLDSEQCDDKQVDDEISETVIFVDEKNKMAQIGFIVGIQCLINGKTSLPTALIDDAGETVSKWDRIMHDRAKAQGPGGNEEIGRHYYKSLNVSKSGQSCFLATDEIVVVNNNFSESWEKKDPWKFRCPNQTTMFIHGGYCPMNDAFTFGNKLVAMFKKFYNVNPLPENRIIMHVHFSTNVGDASYNSAKNAVQFGDGDGDTSYPISSGVSPVGHELGHAILHKHLNECSPFDQCGCLNEAFGDITGTTLRRFHYKRPIQVWQIGNEVFKTEPGNGFPRCLDNPHCNGPRFIDNCSEFKFPNWNPHVCSGVLSKAYYLMAINMPRDVYDAYDIIYCALSKLWEPKMTFTKAAEYSLTATDTLNETRGKWCLARRPRPSHYNVKIVQNAFRKVGIHCKKNSKKWSCSCKG